MPLPGNEREREEAGEEQGEKGLPRKGNEKGTLAISESIPRRSPLLADFFLRSACVLNYCRLVSMSGPVQMVRKEATKKKRRTKRSSSRTRNSRSWPYTACQWQTNEGRDVVFPTGPDEDKLVTPTRSVSFFQSGAASTCF